MPPCPCFHILMSPCLYVSMSLCLHVSMYPCPCIYFHISISMSLFPCLDVSISHVYISHTYVSMLPCLQLHVSMSPRLHVSMFPCLCLHVSGIPQTENGNFRAFAANGNRKQHTHFRFFYCKRKRETKVCFPWSANDKRYSTITVSANKPV